MATPLDFAKALLNRLGLPQTQNRLVSLVAFASIEGGNWAPTLRGTKNPFNTMLPMPGSTLATGKGVRSYPDWATGIEASAKTLMQGNMAGILGALKRDAQPHEFFQAINDSHAWGEGDYTVLGNGQAAYNGYANKQDASGALATTGGAGAVAWVKDHPYATAGLGLLAAAGLVYFLRPDLFRQIPVVGRFAARENPVRRRDRGGSRVQTLIFPRSRFTPAEAKAWAHAHNFKAGKVDVTDQSIRIRQEDPSHFSRMRTIRMGGSPVQAVVGFPR